MQHFILLFLFLHMNACLAITAVAPALSYADVVKDVGFDIRKVASKAQIASLNPADTHAFMGQASELKRTWQKDNITVHPLTLFLATAMDLGSKELIALGTNQDLTAQIFDGVGEGERDQTIYDAANKMVTLLAEVPDVQPHLPSLSPLYLAYRLSGAFADFERLAGVTNLHAPTHYYPVIEALCGKSLAGGDEGKAGMFKFLNPDTADQMMELLPLDKLVRLGLVSSENYINVIRELKRRLTAYITGVPEDIAKNVDSAQARKIGAGLPILLRKDHQGFLRVKDDIVQNIQKAIIGGAIITCDIPDFLKNAFRFEQLGVAAEEALGADVEENRLDRAVMEHIKTRTIWSFGSETNSEETKQKAAQRYAAQYQVFDPSNPLAPVNTSYLIVRVGDLAVHRNSLNHHFVANRSLIMVVDYGDATAINRSPALPDSVRHISFVAPHVTTIGDRFFARCAGLTSVDFSGLSGVTTIGGYFLYNCTGLTSVDFSGLSSVTTIGGSFLSDCTRLASVDLSPLSRVTTIGGSFLSDCTELTSVDFSGLSELTTIGGDFLYNCTGLTSVDFSEFRNVTTIGNYFLYNCTGLTSVDFSGLSGVTTIEHSFLRNCTGLTSVDFSGLSGVTTIGHSFLYHCTGLTRVDFSEFRNVTTLGHRFLNDCTGLTRVDFSGLNSVTTIEDDFLNDCTGLTRVDFSDLSGVTTIGASFLYNCAGLTSVDLSNLDRLSVVGPNFLGQGSNQVTITGTPSQKAWELIQTRIARPYQLARA